MTIEEFLKDKTERVKAEALEEGYSEAMAEYFAKRFEEGYTEYFEERFAEGYADGLAECADVFESVMRENGMSEEDIARVKESYLRLASQRLARH